MPLQTIIKQNGYVYVDNRSVSGSNKTEEPKNQARPRLSEINKAVKNILSGMSYCCALPSRVMDFLRGVYKPLGIEIKDIGDCKRYYSATEIACMLGVYSASGKPHAHAVAAIISKFNIPENQAVAIPYGLVGVMFRYDWRVIESVRNWFAANDNPCDIPHHNFSYHIYRE